MGKTFGAAFLLPNIGPSRNDNGWNGSENNSKKIRLWIEMRSMRDNSKTKADSIGSTKSLMANWPRYWDKLLTIFGQLPREPYSKIQFDVENKVFCFWPIALFRAF